MEQLKNYDTVTITFKSKNLSKLSLNSASSSSGSSSNGSTTTSSISTSGKILKINEYDFTISGYCPSYVYNINVASVAYKQGLRNGDLIIKINNINCCRATLKSIQKLIVKASVQNESLSLTVSRCTKQQIPKQQQQQQQETLPCKKKFKLSSLFKAAVPRSCLSGQLNTTQNTCYYEPEKIIQQVESSTDYENIINNTKSEISIDTITNTTNSYSCYDVTMSETYKCRHESEQNMINQQRTNLIGNLIDQEIEFVDYLSNGVATFSRPLRGFFLRQQDYFTLFQNAEKMLVISENFLQSMQKWSAFDIYIHIGQFYSNKVNLKCFFSRIFC
jgi:hypothetical protein